MWGKNSRRCGSSKFLVLGIMGLALLVLPAGGRAQSSVDPKENKTDLVIGAAEMLAGSAGAMMSLRHLSQNGGSLQERLALHQEKLAHAAAQARLPEIKELIEQTKFIECELTFLLKIRAPNEITEITQAIAELETRYATLATNLSSRREEYLRVFQEELLRLEDRSRRSGQEAAFLRAVPRQLWLYRAGLAGSLYFVYDGFHRIGAYLKGEYAGIAPGIVYSGPVISQLIRESLNPPAIPSRLD